MATPNEQEIISKMHGHYKALKMSNCTKCHSNHNVIPCVFGRPNNDLM